MSLPCDLFHALCHAVRAEYGHAAGRDLIEFVDENGAAPPQIFDHMTIMHDFVTNIDRRPEFCESAFDDLDRPLNARTEAARLGQDDTHDNPSAKSSAREAHKGGSTAYGATTWR